MEPYVKKEISKKDITLFEKIRKTVIELPNDIPLESYGRMQQSSMVSCHILARAIAEKYTGVRVVDGYFCKEFTHSWLTTSKGNIIDVYPVGIIGGPILVFGAKRGPSSFLYKEDKIPINFTHEFFTNNVKIVRDLL